MRPETGAMVLAASLTFAAAHAAATRPSSFPTVGKTWIEIGGVVYGAKPDETGPIGGGPGYRAIVTTGDYRVRTVDEFIEALGKVKGGETVYIEEDADIDCTTLVFAEKLVLEIPGGVTIAGNRGQKGSAGAIIYSDALATKPLMRTLGPDVRLTGLRLRGPDPNRRMDHHRRSFTSTRGDREAQHKYYYKLPMSRGIHTDFPGLEVDNCDVSGWSHCAIRLFDGDKHHIHHNYIHHNQLHGLGYGISHGYGEAPSSLIEFNLFDYNRHSIHGTGKPGTAYEARHNVELGHANGHYFDMHGGADRRDGTSLAGEWLRIVNNTFMRADRKVVGIRGVPREKADIQRNWFCHDKPGERFIIPWPCGGDTHVELHNNAYGREAPALLDVVHASFEQALAAGRAAADNGQYRAGRAHAKAAVDLAQTGPRKSSSLALMARCCEKDHELSGAGIAFVQILQTPDAARRDKAEAKAGLARITRTVAKRRAKEWELVFSDDFEREELGENWRVLGGKWRIADGKLVCGELSRNLILLTHRQRGFQRVEFDAQTDDARPCDLSTFLHSGPAAMESGYYLQFGGSGNTFNSLRRNGVFTLCKCEERFIERGKTHKIVAEFDGVAARLKVDGEVVLEYIDLDPVSGEGHENLGFCVWSSGTIDNVRVYEARRLD